MKAQFTEFSYGYALVDNMRRSGIGAFTAAPVFPSLITEGAAGGGYDLSVPLNGIPLLLQFKVPEVITRRSRRLPDGYAPPYYRMHLRPARHSDQHALLLQHENAGRAVFYVAPRFHTNNDLNNRFLADDVWHQSFRVRPRQIGDLPDNGYHSVAYDLAGSPPVLESNPVKLTGHFDDDAVEANLKKLIPTRTSKQDTLSRFGALFKDLLGMAARSGKYDDAGRRSAERLPPVRGAAYVARVFFDCELFVVGQAKGQEPGKL